MGSNDDLFKAMEMFAGGMRQYHTQQAVNDATKQLQDMHAQQLEEKDQLIANQAIGNELALRLTGIGASPQAVSAATEGLVQSASGRATNMAQKEMQTAGQTFQAGESSNARRQQSEMAGREEVFKAGQSDLERQKDIGMQTTLLKSKEAEAAKDRQLKRDLFGVTSDKEKARRAEKTAKAKKTAVTEFNGTVKKEMESLQSVGDLRKVMNSTDSPMGSNLVRYGLLGVAGAKPISEGEFEKADADPSWRGKIANRLSIEVTGHELADRKVFYNKVVNTLENRAKVRLRERIKNFASSRAKLNPEIDAIELGDAMQTEWAHVLGGAESTKKMPAAMQEAQSWLAHPDNQKDPRRQRVELRLKEMEAAMQSEGAGE